MTATAETLPMRREFIAALRANAKEFGVELADDKVERLADYYDLVQKHNPLLHLVAPCSPEEFATRHILESLTLLNLLPQGVRFADVGSGAGFPSIPCLIVRDDLKAVLIESKEKKAKFLQAAVTELGMTSRVEIVDRQFSEATPPKVYAVTCRALDKFTAKLPQLLKWSGDRTLLFFAGPALRVELDKHGYETIAKLLPLSERRFLFLSRKKRK